MHSHVFILVDLCVDKAAVMKVQHAASVLQLFSSSPVMTAIIMMGEAGFADIYLMQTLDPMAAVVIMPTRSTSPFRYNNVMKWYTRAVASILLMLLCSCFTAT